MKHLKKTLCAILALLMLAGCSPKTPTTTVPTSGTSRPQQTTTQKTPEEPEAPKPGLYELVRYVTGDELRPISAACSEDEAVLLLMDGNDANGGLYIQLLDLEKGEAAQPVRLEQSGSDGYLIGMRDDGGIVRYDPYAANAALYDRQGKYAGEIENPFAAKDDPRFEHELADNRFAFRDDVAVYRSYEGNGYLFSAYAFADDPDALYMADGGYDAICDTAGRTVLEVSYLRGNAGLGYRVLELSQESERGVLTVENDAVGDARDNTYFNALDAFLCGAGVLLRFEKTYYEPGVEYGEDGPEPYREERICLWRLDEDEARGVSVRRVTAPALEQENAAIAERIERLYGICVLLDTAPEGDRPPVMQGDDPNDPAMQSLVTGITPLSTNVLMRQLEGFLEKLPDGFVREMQTDFPGGADAGYQGFDIYVVREIPGGSSAYASGWETRLKIVLATDEFYPSVLPHEFMHLIERRVYAYFDSVGESFWNGWMALNPEGFNYYADDNPYTLVGDCFVSSYAMTNSTEDMAETFMSVFVANVPLSECYWYKDAPRVQAKVAFLLDAIRRSYPSVRAVDKAYWEGK